MHHTPPPNAHLPATSESNTENHQPARFRGLTITRSGPSRLSNQSKKDAALKKESGKGATVVEVPELNHELQIEDRPGEALRAALEVFALTGYWVAFYKAVLGPNGIVSRLFPGTEELDYFTGTREFEEIQQMLAALRTSDLEKTDVVEAVSVITIRIPKSLQASLIEEAKRHGTSMNKLCISKLLTPANRKYVPLERGRVRGRKPQRQNP